MVYCSRCGHSVEADARFCASCGNDLTAGGFREVASSQSQVTVATVAPPTVRYASVGERFVAVLIDIILLAVATAVVAVPFGILAWMGSMGSFFVSPLAPLFNGLFFGFIWFVFWMLYFTYFEATSGQTIGKSAMSIKVVDLATGKTIDFGRAFIRSLLRIIDFLPFLYLVGFILIIATPRKQRLGDFAANTVVVKA